MPKEMPSMSVKEVTKNALFTGCLCAAGAEILHGMSYAFTKQSTNTAGVFFILGWRFLIAAAVMTLCIAAGLIKVRFRGKPLMPLLRVILLCPCVYFLGETLGISRTTSTECGIFVASIPVVSVILSAVLLKNRPSRLQVAGIVTTLVGMVICVTAVGMTASLSVPGYLFMSLGVISYSLYLVCVDKASVYTSAELAYAMQISGAALFTALALLEAIHDGNVGTLVALPFRNRGFLIAVLYLEGEIADEEGDGIVGTEVIKTLKKIAKDKDIKALVLRVNSPGGSADASEQIWHAIQKIKADSIPVVVSMGDYAASGGYYISCGADYIFAEPTTLTGSIGIFGTIPNVGKLRDKVGLDIDGVSTNKHSALEANMIFKGMNAEERALFQTMVERGYDLFTSRCAEGRHVSQDYIKSIGEGRVWLGNKGKEIGIVDELGNIDNAIAKAVELAGLESYKLEYFPDVVDPYEELLKLFDNTTDEEKLLLKLKNFCSKPRIMALMPEVTIK